MAKKKTNKTPEKDKTAPQAPEASPVASETKPTFIGSFLSLFKRKPPTTIRYRVLDWDKVKTTKDLVSVLREIHAFKKLNVGEAAWDKLGHLAGDEVHEAQVDNSIL